MPSSTICIALFSNPKNPGPQEELCVTVPRYECHYCQELCQRHSYLRDSLIQIHADLRRCIYIWRHVTIDPVGAAELHISHDKATVVAFAVVVAVPLFLLCFLDHKQ